MLQLKYFIFPDQTDWIVYAPVSRLVFRTNKQGAERFTNKTDSGSMGQNDTGKQPADHGPAYFAPTNVTIACTNMCAQRCVYCYGIPAHSNRHLLSPEFCRAGLEIAGRNAAEQNEVLRIFFHGVGEPTHAWPLFKQCVQLARKTGARFGVRAYLRICTGGQLEPYQAEWVADHFDEVIVSADGPKDIQNLQRPRADGMDSSTKPLYLARVLRERGKVLNVNATITNHSVDRMPEIVEFAAIEMGATRLNFNMMFAPDWVNREKCMTPDWRKFITGFGLSMDKGALLNLSVQHPTISYETLCTVEAQRFATHFCLAPPNIVTAFYDVPKEGDKNPHLGAYGWFSKKGNEIRFDHEKRCALNQEQEILECLDCPCYIACNSPAGVKGRIPENIRVNGPVCRARIGVFKELIRRVQPCGIDNKETAR